MLTRVSRELIKGGGGAGGGRASVNYFDFVPAALQDDIASGTDTATDQAPYWQAFRDALQAVATAGGTPHGVIPQCSVYTSTSPNFAIPSLQLETQGCPKIIGTSTNPGFRMDGTGLGVGGWGLFGLKVGTLMAGSLGATNGIDIRYCHQSTFDRLIGMGAAYIGLYISFCVSSLFNSPTVSESPFNGAGFIRKPNNGIVITAETGDPIGTDCGWITLMNPIAEHVVNGIVIDRSHGTCLLNGVAESCTIGITLSAAAQYTNIYSTDCEANLTYDVYCSGHYNSFNNMNTVNRVHLTDAASRNNIVGGVHNIISLDSGTTYNIVRDLMYASQANGSLTDAGTGNIINNALNHQTEDWVNS